MNPPRERFRSLLLVIALALLLASELDRFAPAWRQPLFFAHLGFFLLWQPLIAANRRIGRRDALLVVGGALGMTLLFNPWVMLLWSAFVAAMVGGRGFESSRRDQRWLNLGALAFLIAFMFTLVLPDLLPEPHRTAAVAPVVRDWAEFALSLALLVMLAEAIRLARAVGGSDGTPGMYDPVHSVWMLFLLLMVTFSGVALMVLGGRGYLSGIGIALVGIGALLLVVDHLMRQTTVGERRGGVVLLLSRYFLSYAIPYEQWLERLARLSREESDPVKFFESAMRLIVELTPVRGVAWAGALRAGACGDMNAGHLQLLRLPVPDDPEAVVEVRVATRDEASAALAWHVRLLVQVALQFHVAKAREELLRAQQYVRVVHETGARLTHDVKNLLQSLDGLIAATGSVPQDHLVRQLVERQLPEISRRLKQTLSKLQSPEGAHANLVDAGQWWSELQAQYEPQGVRFVVPARMARLQVPADAFSSIADNLLQNALQKRRSEAGLQILATIEGHDDRVLLAIEDSGSRIDADVARLLFTRPVASHTGLGIGLYQMSRLATSQGMQLRLADNRDGRVRFELEYQATRSGAAAANACVSADASLPGTCG